MSRISKRDENVKKLGTPLQNSLSGDAGPSPPAVPNLQVNNHNGDDLKYSLSAPTPDLECAIHKFIVDAKDLVHSSSEHAQLGGDPSSKYGSKQSPVRSGDQDPSLPAVDSGVAYEPSSADEFGSRSPLLSPLFSPLDLLQHDAIVQPQTSSTTILPAPSCIRTKVQVTEASVPRPSSICDDTSETTAVADPTAKRSRPVSVQGLLPVCALDIDFLSTKPRAASAPLLAPFGSPFPQTQHPSSAHEFEQNTTANTSATSNRKKRKQTGSVVSKDRNHSFTPHVELSGKVLDQSSGDSGPSTNRTFDSRSKQTAAEVAIPVTPASFLDSSTPRFLAEMSEAEKQELAKIIEDSIQKTGLLTAPKELIARTRREKRKRNKNMKASTSAIGPDASQHAIPEHSSTTTAPFTDSQEALAPKPKRKRTTKPKKERAITVNPYPRTTTPPDEVPQQDYALNAQQVQGIRTDVPSAPMPSTSPTNVSRGFDSSPPLTVHGDAFSTHASALQLTQLTAPGSAPYSFNGPRNLDINHPQERNPGAVHLERPAHYSTSMNYRRLLWQRAQIARQMQARWQAGFNDQRYHASSIPNSMAMPVAGEGGWNPQAPSLPSHPLPGTGLPYSFDAAQSTQGVGGQPRIQSNLYPQHQVPSFDHNIQSGLYHMKHPFFNQAPAGPSHSLQPHVFSPTFSAQHTPSTYEQHFPPINFFGERGADYMTRSTIPTVRAPLQNYPQALYPSFVDHTVQGDLTTTGQIPAATSSMMCPLPGSFIGDEPTNATR